MIYLDILTETVQFVRAVNSKQNCSLLRLNFQFVCGALLLCNSNSVKRDT